METPCLRSPLESTHKHERAFNQTGADRRESKGTRGIYIQVGGVHDGAVAAAEHEAAHGRELLQPFGLQDSYNRIISEWC
jgi:hypothetical protein